MERLHGILLFYDLAFVPSRTEFICSKIETLVNRRPIATRRVLTVDDREISCYQPTNDISTGRYAYRIENTNWRRVIESDSIPWSRRSIDDPSSLCCSLSGGLQLKLPEIISWGLPPLEHALKVIQIAAIRVKACAGVWA